MKPTGDKTSARQRQLTSAPYDNNIHVEEEVVMTIMTDSTDVPKYVSILEAAEAMGRSMWDVFRLVEAGEIQSVKYGRLLLVRAYDVEQLGGVL